MLARDTLIMRPRSNVERRRNQRVATPSGMWVSWRVGKQEQSITSRVRDFSLGGAFIASEETVPVGSRLDLHFSLPEGQIQVQGIVRNVREGKGMGVEFVSMPGTALDLILAAMKRMLV